MTGEDLGRRMEPSVSKQTIAHWEADRYRPHIDQVAQLCQILGMSADALVLGVTDTPSPRAAEIAAIYDALAAPEKARIEMMLKALGLSDAIPQTRDIDRTDRAGKPHSKVLHAAKIEEHNDQKEPEFGPALTKFFNSGRGAKDGGSSKYAAAPKTAAPARKRGGGRS